MAKFDYKRAGEEIAQINAIVETCPEAVKEKCFELLFAAVFNTEPPVAVRPVEGTEAQGAKQEERPDEQEKDLPPPNTIIIPPLPTVPDRNVPTLTDEAKELLLEAAKSRDGTLMRVKFIDGVAITTNDKQFAEAGNPRSCAAWEGALDELETHNLIQPLGPKREVYQVTREGYRMAEFLRG
jgi:hypothetical protein